MANGETQAERLRQAMGGMAVRDLARRLAARTGRKEESVRRQINAWLGGKNGISDENAALLAKELGVSVEAIRGRDLLDAEEVDLLAAGLSQIRAGLQTLDRLQRRLAR